MTPKTHQERPVSNRDVIKVRGSRTNNLRDVDVDIPKKKLTVVTGVSGSGKSSLAFDTIAAESQRLLAATYPAFVQNGPLTCSASHHRTSRTILGRDSAPSSVPSVARTSPTSAPGSATSCPERDVPSKPASISRNVVRRRGLEARRPPRTRRRPWRAPCRRRRQRRTARCRTDDWPTGQRRDWGVVESAGGATGQRW